MFERRRKKRRRKMYSGANAVNEEDPERDRANPQRMPNSPFLRGSSGTKIRKTWFAGVLAGPNPAEHNPAKSYAYGTEQV